MPRKRKGELPSGSIRRQLYIGKEQKLNSEGLPVFDDFGKPIMVRKYKSITASTSSEVDSVKAEIKAILPEIRPVIEMTLRDAIQKYINSSDAVLSPTTLRSYKMILKHGFESIMDIKISMFSNDLLKNAVNIESKRMTKGKKPHKISPKTVSNEYGLIASVLNTYYPSLNTAVKLPAKEKNQHELSTPDVIFNLVKDTEIELPVMLAVWLSFSLSEIMGLTKSKSISSDGNYISIVQVTVTVSGLQITKSTAKQPTRHRQHRIPPYIKKLISKVETDQLVTISPSSVSNRFKRIVINSGIPYMTFHDLRHVSASVMKYLNVPDKYAQERGGWKTDAVMKGTYMQTFSSARIEVDDIIDKYYDELLFEFQDNLPKKEYEAWLTLFGAEDTDEEKEYFKKYLFNVESIGKSTMKTKFLDVLKVQE